MNLYEPPHQKTNKSAYAKTKTQISCAVTGAFGFATKVVQFLFYLNPKFQASAFVTVTANLCQTWLENQIADFLMTRLTS